MTVRDLLIRTLPNQYFYFGEAKMVNGRMIDEMVTRGRVKDFLDKLYNPDLQKFLDRKVWLIQSINDSLHVNLKEEVNDEKKTKEEAR